MESLYRKYRPLTFDSVVGQQHIVSTLEHAITEGRLSHAYLFCGPRRPSAGPPTAYRRDRAS